MKKFNLKNLNEIEGNEQHQVEVSTRFAAFENVDDVDINRPWETIGENIKMSAKESLSYYELKQHKPWLCKRCSKQSDERKQAKLQWLQDPKQMNVDNMNNVRREASRHFRNKKRVYTKDKINEIVTH
jgi:hypothetical protein